MKRTLSKWGMVLVTPTLIQSVSAQEVQLFNGFETAADVARANPNNSQLQATAQHATEGGQALRIEFQPSGEWPNAAFAAPQPWDWSQWGVLVVDVTNPGDEMIEIGVGAGDTPEDGTKHWISGSVNLAPGNTATIGLPLKNSVQDLGMDGVPGKVPNCTLLRSYGQPLDLKRVTLFTIFTRTPKTAIPVVVDNIRLAGETRIDKIVDKFGQYTGAQWSGKVVQDTDLAKARSWEEADLKTHVSKGLNRFGGWMGGPQLKVTGFFRIEKVNGKWWLVDPEGRLFFSTGITTINHNEPLDQYTRLTGRESFFSWLPNANDSFDARHTSVRGNQTFFNFYDANLERKYGTNYETTWLEMTKSRLLSWGFNTVGDFSSVKVTNLGIPHVVTMGAWGGHKRVKAASIDIDDPFDPQFAVDLAQNLKNLARTTPNDPYCIGYFVDNELTWGGSASNHERYSLALAVLAMEADSPAKTALLSQLRQKYPDVATLNARWNTGFGNWEALNAAFWPNENQEKAMEEDLKSFMKTFSEKYYRTVRDTVKAHDPNHLYLGDKYMVSRYTPEVLQSATAFCDVVSFDIYEGDVSSPKWDALKTLDKPCIIGEFHFGALDRGMFGAGMVAVANQNARAIAYERYVRSVAQHPAFVGCHWFQYVDEPLTARAFDRENHNVGFVNVCDNPYPELVSAARRANASVYSQRFQP